MDPQTTLILNILNDPRYTFVFLMLIAWSLAWRGIALWKSAQHNQKNWFIALLIINTFGILDIIYIFYFSHPNRKMEEQK